MGDQEPGPFDVEKFKGDVKAKVEGMAPPATLEEADEFEKSGKAGQATSAIHEIVATGKADSAHDIKETSAAPPEPGGQGAEAGVGHGQRRARPAAAGRRRRRGSAQARAALVDRPLVRAAADRGQDGRG